MLPSIRELEAIEMMRDGGSLAATYNDGRQSAVLLLKIEIRVRGDGKSELVKFEQPVVLGGEPVHWRRPIEWSEARQALRTMKDLSGFLGSQSRTLLSLMSRISDLNGARPPEGDPFWKSYQHLTT